MTSNTRWRIFWRWCWQLEKFISKKNDLEIAMVSDNNYFMFQPMLPGVAWYH